MNLEALSEALDVDARGHELRLVRDDATGSVGDAREADHDIGGEQGDHLKEVSIVGDSW